METYIFDIETAPNLGYYFDLWKEGNIVSTEKSWYILSFSIKKLGETKVHTYGLPDFKGYKRDKEDDYQLCKKLHEYFEKADILIGHNVNSFDIKKVNARFIQHRLSPPKPYKTIDTLLIARRIAKFDSNRLDAVARSLGMGRKLPHNGFDTWKGCMTGDMASWRLMKRYNAQDVVLTEKVYLALRPWTATHPNINLIDRKLGACPKCKHTHLQKRGMNYNATSERQQYQCMNCLGWCYGPWEKIASRVTIK